VTTARPIPATTRRTAVLLGIVLASTGACPRSVLADDPPAADAQPAAAAPEPTSPFAALVDSVTVGTPVVAGPYRVVPFTMSVGSVLGVRREGPPAWVGFRGSGAEILDLPAPAGQTHVRASNPLAVPIEVPAGEMMRSPGGAIRVVDRFLWIPPGQGTFVPVAELPFPPAAPFTPLPMRMTPAQQGAGGNVQALTATNVALGLAASPEPAASYDSPAFVQNGGPVLVAIERIHLDAQEPLVGLALFDAEGLRYATVESDPARFMARWPALEHGIALDAAVRARVLGSVNPPLGPPTTWTEPAANALAELREMPATRAAYGAGLEAKWPAAGPKRWSGLIVDDKPIEATLVLPTNIPQPGAPPPRPPAPPPPPTPPAQPGTSELNRREPRNGLEERLKDRRDNPPGSPGR
jgi:hypothetical protein